MRVVYKRVIFYAAACLGLYTLCLTATMVYSLFRLRSYATYIDDLRSDCVQLVSNIVDYVNYTHSPYSSSNIVYSVPAPVVYDVDNVVDSGVLDAHFYSINGVDYVILDGTHYRLGDFTFYGYLTYISRSGLVFDGHRRYKIIDKSINDSCVDDKSGTVASVDSDSGLLGAFGG